MDKLTFISRLKKTRAQWETELAQMNGQRMLQPGIVGSWSVKDLIAHVSWYEREMVPVIRLHIFTGSELWELPADERNEKIYQQNIQRPLQEIIDEGQRSYSDLLAVLQSLSDEDLNDPLRFRDMPEDWVPWQIFAGNSFEHYQDHLPALHTWITDGQENSIM
ncbi:MAG TPA: DinB family protein [Ktedonobacteraceae bacterium]|nr:DinB family protein [Ktedonobacteraceae bacterium]